ncbi:hypothetical protein D9M68_480210 [compost metagenome]
MPSPLPVKMAVLFELRANATTRSWNVSPLKSATSISVASMPRLFPVISVSVGS